MAGNEKQTASKWVDSIDIGSDGKKDIFSEELKLKEHFKKDLQELWNRKTEGKITEAEYVRYANACQKILQKHDATTQEIKQEYLRKRKEVFSVSDTALDNLQSGLNYVKNKVVNLGTDTWVSIQQKIISEDTLQTFTSTGGNDLISIQDFEKQLSSGPMEELNSLAMKNYLIHLKSKGLLNKSTLEQKCGGPDRLFELSVLWGTKMEKDEHLRNALGKNMGFKAKTETWKNAVAVGGVESITERIFKTTIVDVAKRAEWGSDFLNKKGKKGIEFMDYESIIDKLEKEFHGKKITTAVVNEFFKKKIQEGTNKLHQLEQEKKELSAHQTVGSCLEVCQVRPDNTVKNIVGKNISALTDTENKKVFALLKSADITNLPKNIKHLLDKEKEIQTQKEKINDFQSIVKSKAATETIAQNHNHHKTSEELAKSVAPTIEQARLKRRLEEQDDVYQNELKRIGFSSIGELTNDTTKLSLAISRLEGQGLEKTKLYETLKQYSQKQKQLEKREAREYIKATENISEEELQSQEKRGRTLEQSAEKLYEADVKKQKTSDFTVPKEQGAINIRIDDKIGESLSSEYIRSTLSGLGSGQRISVDFKGNNPLFIEKNGDGFNVMDSSSKTEYCKTPREVENYVDSWKFFHEIGCGFMAESMGKVLETMQQKDKEGGKPFDMKRGLLPEERIAVMNDMKRILNLPISFDGKKETTMRRSFANYLFNKSSTDSSLKTEARKRGLIGTDGTFALEAFKNELHTLA